jgi:hypothetical protein
LVVLTVEGVAGELPVKGVGVGVVVVVVVVVEAVHVVHVVEEEVPMRKLR